LMFFRTVSILIVLPMWALSAVSLAINIRRLLNAIFWMI
jgi:hypothetical protein